ncbi:metalloregulator ArsR/SmtB family transcription factor [Saccharopolyspora sp. NPDC049426]|uniref:ArsR/SmtB family transcription factor n=1 Tax=Saccharopolyspora sp. NPDC049426 TaxID=3155652 RepID=UPI0034214147
MHDDASMTRESHVETLKAIADPVRLDLLRRVASVPEMACTALVEETHISKSTVSYHMRTLRTAGLIDVRKEGRNYFYTFVPDSMQALTSALGEIGS